MGWETRPDDAEGSRSCRTCRYLVRDCDDWQCWRRGREQESHPRFPFATTQCWGWEEGTTPNEPPDWWLAERERAAHKLQKPQKAKPVKRREPVTLGGKGEHATSARSLRLRFPLQLVDVVDEVYRMALEESGGNKTLAAFYLGVHVKTVYNRVKSWEDNSRMRGFVAGGG